MSCPWLPTALSTGLGDNPQTQGLGHASAMPSDVGERPVLRTLPDVFGHMWRNDPIAVRSARIQSFFDQSRLFQGCKGLPDLTNGKAEPCRNFTGCFVFGQRSKNKILDRRRLDGSCRRHPGHPGIDTMTEGRDFTGLGQRRQRHRQCASLFWSQVRAKFEHIIWTPVEAGPDVLKHGLIDFTLRLRLELAKDPRLGLMTSKFHCDAPSSIATRSLCVRLL